MFILLLSINIYRQARVITNVDDLWPKCIGLKRSKCTYIVSGWLELSSPPNHRDDRPNHISDSVTRWRINGQRVTVITGCSENRNPLYENWCIGCTHEMILYQIANIISQIFETMLSEMIINTEIIIIV